MPGDKNALGASPPTRHPPRVGSLPSLPSGVYVMLRERQVQALCSIFHLGLDSTVKTLHMPMTSATKLLCLSLS
jgi:hypothetical protein